MTRKIRFRGHIIRLNALRPSTSKKRPSLCPMCSQFYNDGDRIRMRFICCGLTDSCLSCLGARNMVLCRYLKEGLRNKGRGEWRSWQRNWQREEEDEEDKKTEVEGVAEVETPKVPEEDKPQSEDHDEMKPEAPELEIAGDDKTVEMLEPPEVPEEQNVANDKCEVPEPKSEDKQRVDDDGEVVKPELQAPIENETVEVMETEVKPPQAPEVVGEDKQEEESMSEDKCEMPELISEEEGDALEPEAPELEANVENKTVKMVVEPAQAPESQEDKQEEQNVSEMPVLIAEDMPQSEDKVVKPEAPELEAPVENEMLELVEVPENQEDKQEEAGMSEDKCQVPQLISADKLHSEDDAVEDKPEAPELEAPVETETVERLEPPEVPENHDQEDKQEEQSVSEVPQLISEDKPPSDDVVEPEAPEVSPAMEVEAADESIKTIEVVMEENEVVSEVEVTSDNPEDKPKEKCDMDDDDDRDSGHGSSTEEGAALETPVRVSIDIQTESPVIPEVEEKQDSAMDVTEEMESAADIAEMPAVMAEVTPDPVTRSIELWIPTEQRNPRVVVSRETLQQLLTRVIKKSRRSGSRRKQQQRRRRRRHSNRTRKLDLPRRASDRLKKSRTL